MPFDGSGYKLEIGLFERSAYSLLHPSVVSITASLPTSTMTMWQLDKFGNCSLIFKLRNSWIRRRWNGTERLAGWS